MDRLKRLFNRLHVALYRLSGGAIGGRLMGLEILLLSTTGRRTRRKRTTPLACFRDEGGVFVIGADAGAARHPGWVHNLRSDPRCAVQLGGTRRSLQAQLVEGDARDRCYQVFRERAPELAADYERKTSRVFPVFRFPWPS